MKFLPCLLSAMVATALLSTTLLAHEHPRHVDTDAAPDAIDHDLSVQEHLEHFRSGGDERHLDLAWSEVAPSLESSRDAGLLIDAATIAQAQHRFDDAVALVERALALTPNDRQAWLLKASIHLVGGNTEDADRACGQLRSVATLVVLTCQARVDIAAGRSTSALRTLGAVLHVLDRATADPHILAWALSVAGDAAADASPQQAVGWYRESVQLQESTQVRAALVDVLLDMGDLSGAEAALAEAGGGLALEVRRMILAVRSNRTATVIEDIDALDREFRRWIARNDVAHAREMARFYLDVVDQPALARQLAAANYSIQREVEDQRLVARTQGN